MAQLTEEVGEVARIIARRYGEQSEKESGTRDPQKSQIKKSGAEVPRKDRFGFHPAYVHPSSHFDTTWQRVATRQSAFGIGVGSNR